MFTFYLIDTMMAVSKVRLDLIVKQGQVVYITWRSIYLYNLKMWYWKCMSENKEQLIQLVFKDLVANAMLIFLHKLTVTGKTAVSLQIFNGHISCCENVGTTQEEADTIIIHHVIASFLHCSCILRSLVTLNHRYTCSQQTKNHRHMSQILLHLTRVILRSRKTSLQDMAYLDVTQFVQTLALGRKQL